MKSEYSDVINLPHHRSARRPHMSAEDRAAQFSSFAALSGFEDAVSETARLTDRQIELSEDEIAALDEKLRALAEIISSRPQAAITYFEPDKQKSGGAYLTVTGQIKRFDTLERTIVFCDGTKIGIDSVIDVQQNATDL
jgi:hypothetical protein